VSKPDLLTLWVKFGGGPKTEAEAQRRSEIAALTGDLWTSTEALPDADELRALLAEVERSHATPRVAANALRFMARGKKTTRKDRDYDPQAVWLAIQAQERKRIEGQA
jgi:hypothetical protein